MSGKPVPQGCVVSIWAARKRDTKRGRREHGTYEHWFAKLSLDTLVDNVHQGQELIYKLDPQSDGTVWVKVLSEDGRLIRRVEMEKQ